MKLKKIFILCLINLFIPHTAFAMDFGKEGEIPLNTIYYHTQRQTVQTITQPNPIYMRPSASQHSFENIITTIDTAINTQYAHKPIFSPLSSENALAIIKTIQQYYGEKFIPSNDLIGALYTKNNIFKKAIKHFLEHAKNNLETITASNLFTIANPEKQQPTPALNTLPLAIKKYCMNNVLKKIDHRIEIALSGHTEKINNYDIHGQKHLAATSSLDESFRLWSLATGKEIYKFPETAVNGYIRFNNDGSWIVTGTTPTPEQTQIKIWDLNSKQVLYSMHRPNITLCVRFFDDHSKMMNIIEKIDNISSRSILYEIDKNHEPKRCGARNIPRTRKDIIVTNMDFYYSAYPTGNILYVMKDNCHMLYLCEKAIEKTSTMEPLQKLTSFLSHLKLTDYEKDIVRKKIQERTEYLSNPGIFARMFS